MSENTSNTGGNALVFKGMGICFILLTIPFALWGAANNMTDMLVPAFKRVMSMTQLHSSMIQMAFYGAYFCMALPAAFIIKKFSYKTGVVSGLFVYAIGAFLCFPASQVSSFTFFLIAFYVFAGGCAILETCVAPYVISMGPDESATRRINLAQSFNPIGSLAGLFLGKELILGGLAKITEDERVAMATEAPEKLAEIQGKELSNVVVAYAIIGVVSLILGIIILIKKFPKGGEEEDDHKPEHAFGPTVGRLFKNKNYVMSVIAQFFYVGCQIGVWTYTIDYVIANNPTISEPKEASNYMIIGLFLFTASRFICTFLMKFIDPARLLTIITSIAAILCAVVIWGGGATGGYALVAISACMSLCFPTIYGLGLTGLDDNDRKLGGSGIIMAIVGGAVLVPTQGLLSDKMGINLCYLMPFASFILVAIYGIIAHNKEEEVGIVHD
ncbi:L-fucose:H+ symporter permease [Lentisphaera marina]|uniref:L-fucose:H+ symporter permease n=1 Tax=Lentisphaera marina TaxID=1111041 RepID=UPI0023673FAD|nr:L-fucose:H+ symporter permease [Lentisphaera marina]MDD7986697.1 L-fucose:H+ symporter permease [Lentisphaera marina]